MVFDCALFFLYHFLGVEVKQQKKIALSFTSYSDIRHHTVLATLTHTDAVQTPREAQASLFLQARIY